MAGEQDIGKGSDRANVSDRITERESKTSTENLPDIDQPMAKKYQENFRTYSNENGGSEMLAPKPGETAEQYKLREAQWNRQRAEQKNVNPLVLEDSKTGETFYDARTFHQKPTETVQEGVKSPQNPPANGDLLAAKPTQFDQSDKTKIADKPRETPETEAERHARIVKEHYVAGQNLDAFLQRPSISKAGEMSPTFARGVKELRECKWKGDIRVWTGSPIENPDYSAAYSLIEVDSQARPNRQLESFAHEAFHATHQDLEKLYGGQKAVSPSEFVSIKMRQEAGAFYREAMVNEELTSRPLNFDKTKAEYVFVNSKGEPQTQYINDLIVRTPDGKPDEAKSLAAIETFLRRHPSLIADLRHPGSYQKDANGKYRVNDYVAHYSSGYKGYVKYFAQNQKAMHDKHYL